MGTTTTTERVTALPVKEVLKRVSAVNPTLAEALRAVAGRGRVGTELRGFLAEYEFGEPILGEGKLLMPGEEDRPAAPDELLEGPAIPLCVVLDGEVEVFTPVRPSSAAGGVPTLPHRVLHPGGTYGLFEVVDHMTESPTSPVGWHASAGPRTLYIASPMGDRRLMDRVEARVGFSVQPRDPWSFVKPLSRMTSPAWRASVLMLGGAWLSRDLDTKGDLFRWVACQAWADSHPQRVSGAVERQIDKHLHNQFTLQKKVRILRTLRHVSAIVQGTGIAFRPAVAAHASHLIRVERELFSLLGAVKGRNSETCEYPAILCPRHLQPGDTGFLSLATPNIDGHEELPEASSIYAAEIEPLLRLFEELFVQRGSSRLTPPSFLQHLDPAGLQVVVHNQKFSHRGRAGPSSNGAPPGRFDRLRESRMVVPQDGLDAKEFIPEDLGDCARLGATSPFFSAAIRVQRK